MDGEMKEVDKPWGNGLYYVCLRFLRKVLWGTASTDVIESTARQLADEAEHAAQWAIERRGDWTIVERAIDYLACQHDGPWQGIAWFRQSLGLVMELAVPNTGLDESAAAFLQDLQRGIGESFQSSPVERHTLRLSDESAEQVQVLVEAGCQFGLVSDVLDVAERVFNGDALHEDDQAVLHVASVAAVMTRVRRRS